MSQVKFVRINITTKHICCVFIAIPHLQFQWKINKALAQRNFTCVRLRTQKLSCTDEATTETVGVEVHSVAFIRTTMEQHSWHHHPRIIPTGIIRTGIKKHSTTREIRRASRQNEVNLFINRIMHFCMSSLHICKLVDGVRMP